MSTYLFRPLSVLRQPVWHARQRLLLAFLHLSLISVLAASV